MYLTPDTSCMKFFLDKWGLAAGILLSAFEDGAALAPMVIDAALDYFFVGPELIGLTLMQSVVGMDQGLSDGDSFGEIDLANGPNDPAPAKPEPLDLWSATLITTAAGAR